MHEAFSSIGLDRGVGTGFLGTAAIAAVAIAAAALHFLSPHCNHGVVKNKMFRDVRAGALLHSLPTSYYCAVPEFPAQPAPAWPFCGPASPSIRRLSWWPLHTAISQCGTSTRGRPLG